MSLLYCKEAHMKDTIIGIGGAVIGFPPSSPRSDNTQIETAVDLPK